MGMGKEKIYNPYEIEWPCPPYVEEDTKKSEEPSLLDKKDGVEPSENNGQIKIHNTSSERIILIHNPPRSHWFFRWIKKRELPCEKLWISKSLPQRSAI